MSTTKAAPITRPPISEAISILHKKALDPSIPFSAFLILQNAALYLMGVGVSRKPFEVKHQWI